MREQVGVETEQGEKKEAQENLKLEGKIIAVSMYYRQFNSSNYSDCDETYKSWHNQQPFKSNSAQKERKKERADWRKIAR